MSDIASQTKSIQMIFQHFYEVPKYQRDYVWDDELAINLLTDLVEGSDSSSDQYFIGAIVLQKKDENSFFIVDGQQRLSTLFLILLALRNKVKNIDGSDDNLIQNYIFQESTTARGTVNRNFRIRYNFTQTNDLVKRIYENSDEFNLQNDSKRIEKFIEAFKQLDDEINRKFTTVREVRTFLHFMIHKVHCLPFIATTEAEALKVFDILNSKGVDLSTIDLLKNLLFTILGEEKWDDFSDRWDVLLDKFELTKIDKTKFLRYFTVYKDKEVIPEKKLYTEISNNPNKYGLTSPEIYLKDITKAVDYLLELKNNQNPLVEGEKIPIIDYINKLSTQSKQHIPLTMNLWKESINCSDQSILINGLKLIESFLFSNKILKYYTGDIEVRFNKWCIELPEDDPDNTNDYLINERNNLISERATEVELELHKADIMVHSKQFIRWCLIRIENYLQNITSENSSQSYMDSFKSFQIEHIIPTNTYANLPLEEQEIFKNKINNIGNLTLLEKSLNAAIQDKEFNIKRNIYSESNSFLTKSIHSKITSGNSSYTNMYQNLKVYEEFGADQINDRNRLLTNILLKSVFR